MTLIFSLEIENLKLLPCWLGKLPQGGLGQSPSHSSFCRTMKHILWHKSCMKYAIIGVLHANYWYLVRLVVGWPPGLKRWRGID